MPMSDNKRLNRVIQNLEQTLTQFDTRLSTIENRLSQLESGRNVILNEQRVIERAGRLGGKTFLTSPTGGIEREIRIPICDVCGSRINEAFIICQGCGRKLCINCAIAYQNTNLCVACLRNLIPLTKQTFKVLVCIANGIDSADAIAKITHIPKDDVRKCRNLLTVLGLVLKKGVSIFSKICISDNGLDAICAYRQVFGKNDDIIQFDIELRSYLAEKGR
jgi:hypothetical protein